MIFHQPSNSRGGFNFNSFIYRDTEWKQHFHKNYELIYVKCGNADIRINDEKINLTKGCAVLLFPYSVHSIKINSLSTVWIGVFSDDYISEYSNNHKNKSYAIIRLSEAIGEFLENDLFKAHTPQKYYLIGYLNIVCGQLDEYGEYTKKHGDMSRMAEILKYIDNNYTDEISMTQAAQVLGYEYHYFSKIFHNCFSINFSEFVNMYRVENASRLLNSDSDMSIADIAEKSGFKSIRNFNRCFKKIYGTSPSDYRKITD